MNIVGEVTLPIIETAAVRCLPIALTAAELELSGNRFCSWKHNRDQQQNQTETFHILLPDDSGSCINYSLKVTFQSVGEATKLLCEFGSESAEPTPDLLQIFKITMAVLETAAS